MAKSALPFGSGKQAPPSLVFPPPAKQITLYSRRYKEEQTARPICALPIVFPPRVSLFFDRVRAVFWVHCSLRLWFQEKKKKRIKDRKQMKIWKTKLKILVDLLQMPWRRNRGRRGRRRRRRKVNTKKTRSLLSPIARSGSTPPESIVLTVVPGDCRWGGGGGSNVRWSLIKIHQVLRGLSQGNMDLLLLVRYRAALSCTKRYWWRRWRKANYKKIKMSATNMKIKACRLMLSSFALYLPAASLHFGLLFRLFSV